jgi:tRNA modification GTPase
MATPANRSALLAGGDDTIVARATPEGRGALAIVRLSGPAARPIAQALGAPGDPWTPRTATRVAVRHPQSGERLDDAVMTAFVAPHSFTGEDAVEITTHGGRVVSTLVMAACVAAGARLALPGEFTRRAVLNGKLDVLQAEAIGDLIDARTTAMHHQALSQLDGGLSRRLLALRDDVIQLEALLAYDIDFPEEDDGPIAPERIARGATTLLESLDRVLATAPRGAMLRDGALVVIAGPPNAGKSSLFNALLGDARALVTPIAGTTRDAVDALLDRTPVPLRLVDTAGLRETQDTLERLGIEVSERYLASAQVVLACGETAYDVEQARDAIRPLSNAPVIAVHTKADQLSAATLRRSEWSYVSAESGSGLASLLSMIDIALSTTDGTMDFVDSQDIAITRERHARGLREARDEVQAFLDGWQSQALPATVAAVHLQAARDALSELVGAIGTEDILDRVFADFCIGK